MESPDLPEAHVQEHGAPRRMISYFCSNEFAMAYDIAAYVAYGLFASVTSHFPQKYFQLDCDPNDQEKILPETEPCRVAKGLQLCWVMGIVVLVGLIIRLTKNHVTRSEGTLSHVTSGVCQVAENIVGWKGLLIAPLAWILSSTTIQVPYKLFGFLPWGSEKMTALKYWEKQGVTVAWMAAFLAIVATILEMCVRNCRCCAKGSHRGVGGSTDVEDYEEDSAEWSDMAPLVPRNPRPGDHEHL